MMKYFVLAVAICCSGGAACAQSESYKLQPKDELSTFSVVAKEINDKHFRVDENGEVNFPLVGRLSLAGSTVAEAESQLAIRLQKYYREPDVALNVTSVRTQPISILGSVANPGVQQIKGPVKLIEAISLAGGLRTDAGPTVMITRPASSGAIDHPKAAKDSEGNSTLSVDLTELIAGRAPLDNILIVPTDVLSVPAAQVVYVVGNVKKAGGFTLNGRPNLSVIQALSLAEGLDPRAAPKRGQILRRDSEHEQHIAVDLKKILKGEAEDVVLRPNDVLFVPSSTTKVITTRTIDTALQVGTGMMIWH